MLKKAISVILLVILVLGCCGCGPKGTGRKVAVTFQLNNGYEDIVMEMDEGIPMKNAPTPTMRGAKFVGWSTGKEMWDMKKDNVTEGLVLSARWAVSEEGKNPDPNAGVLSEGTDLRVCAFNVLKCEGANLTDVKPRIQGLLDMMVNYKMDVVSFQEFDQYWRSYFTDRVGKQSLPFKLVSQSVKGDTSAFHNIGYNTNSVTLKDCGVVKYTTPSGYASDFMWAQFETKTAEKKQFIVISMAWNYNTPTYRLEQCELVSDWVQDKIAATGLPVISMGDYNDYESSAPCKNYLANNQMKDAKLEAPRKGLVTKSFHSMPEPDTYTDTEINMLETIDHIYYTKEFSSLYYDVIISNDVLIVSDHNPVYADLKFN